MSVRQLAKQTLFGLTQHAGLNRLARWRARDQLLVVGYHAVVADDTPPDDYRQRSAISRHALARQLESLARDFSPVSVDDVRRWVAGHASLPPSAVLVTFDDGYRNNLRLAAPELARVGIPGLVAVATDLIGSDALMWTHELDERVLQWSDGELPLPGGGATTVPGDASGRVRLAARIRTACKALRTDDRGRYLESLRHGPVHLSDWQHQLYDFMSWDEVRSLQRMGWTIGSHTMTHPILSRLDEQALRTELVGSKHRIEQETGRDCVSLVYPNGGVQDVTDDVFRVGREVGYELGFLLTGRAFNPSPPASDPLRLDRVCLSGRSRRWPSPSAPAASCGGVRPSHSGPWSMFLTARPTQ